MSPFQIIFLLYLCHFSDIQCESIQSALLNVITPSSDGAQVNILNTDDIRMDNNSWNINVSTQIGYSLQLNLDGSWGFDSAQISTITISIDAYIQESILISFSVHNEQYITTQMDINNTNIYPQCNTVHAVGNINNISNTQNNQSLSYKSTNGQKMDHMFSGNSRSLSSNPLIFTLTNNPFINELMITLNNYNETCIYNSFMTEQGMDIFIGGDIGIIYSIHQFNIQYSMDSIYTTDTAIAAETSEYILNTTTSDAITINLHKLLEIEIIGITGGTCFLVCILSVIGYRFRMQRNKKERDRKLAYALQMANGTPPIKPKSEEQHFNIIITPADEQQKNIQPVTPTTPIKYVDDIIRSAYAYNQENNDEIRSPGSDQIVSYI